MDAAPNAAQAMLAVGYRETCEATALTVSQGWTKPTIRDDEVLIEVHAFGLNFADVLSRKGLYPDAPPHPFVPGYEVSGKILEIGANCEREGFSMKVGDKAIGFTLFGGYAQYAVSRHIGVVPLPEGMSYAEGASLPVNLATAYHCLFFTGTLFAGDRVLVHAAAGGVGQIAVQMAKQAGCEVFVTAGSSAKLDILRDQYGADHGINYRSQDFVAEVRRITGVAKGGCIDVILDPIGGSQLKEGVSLLRAGGRIISFGAAALSERNSFTGFFSTIPKVLSMLTFNTIELLSKSKSFVGVNMLAIAKDRPDLLRRSLVAGMELIKNGSIRTVLSKQFDWREVGVAQLEMENRRTTGKIVFVIPRPEDPSADLLTAQIVPVVDVTEAYRPPQ